MPKAWARRARPFVFIGALALVPILAAGLGLPAGTAPRPTNVMEAVRFSYGEGSTAEGVLTGTCHALAATRAANQGDVLSGLADGGTLHVVEAWKNLTVGASGPASVDLDSGTRHRRVDLPPGAFQLRTLAAQHLLLQSPGMTIGFEASFLRAGKAAAFADAAGAPESSEFRGHGGSGRAYEFVGKPLTVEADLLILYFLEAELEAGSVHERIPGAKASPPNPFLPGGLIRSNYTYQAWMVLSNARLGLAADGARPLCGSLDVDVDGRFIGLDVQGEALIDGTWAPLESRSLLLEGRLAIHEEIAPLSPASEGGANGPPEGPPPTGHARFQTGVAASAAETRRLDTTQGVTLAAVLAATALALWKLVAFLFSRLDERRALDSPVRRRILDVVLARPGLALVDLGVATGIPYSTLRHHVRVLHRHRHLTAFKLRGVWHFAPDAVQARVERGRLLLAGDRALASVVAQATAQPGISVREVLIDLERGLGLTPSGARKVVRRAIRLSFLQRMVKGREAQLLPRHDLDGSRTVSQIRAANDGIR